MPNFQYSNIQYTDMVLSYGMANGNQNESLRLYLNYFGHHNDQQVPTNGRVLMRVVQRLRDYGSFSPRNSDAGGERNHPIRDLILDHFNENPEDSTRSAGRLLDVPHSTVHKVLKDDLRHPFKLSTVQALLPSDYENRMNYCQWLISKLDDDASFISNVLWSDESTFQRSGMFNRRNVHLWARDNPHAFRQTAHQHRWSINVWAGILGNHLVGPYFIPSRLTGEIYKDFLNNELAEFLDELPLDFRRRVYFQQDGAPAHHSRIVREVLDREFGSLWIGRNGPNLWPARSPDLTPLDFFLWGYIKDIVYATDSSTEEVMRQKIIEAFNKLRSEAPQIFPRVHRDTARRAHACITMQGQNFEHLPL